MHRSSISDASSVGLSRRRGLAPGDDLEGAHIRARARALLFGRDEPVRLGRLELVSRIGAGGMGEVFLARDVELARLVAVKLMRADSDCRDAAARFAREAQSMARLAHPNVVRIYDVGRLGERVYITMEYVEGTTLQAWLDAAPRPWREVLARFVLAGRGLAAAHHNGLVHRDFKPANVLVASDGRVLVADFGLARVRVDDVDPGETLPAAPAADDAPAGSLAAALLVTGPGSVLGTPGYMAPEQLRAAAVDERGDLFSFCVALYAALYGVHPFAGDTIAALLANIEAGRLTSPARRTAIPAGIRRTLARGLAADPRRRPPSMQALLAALERAANTPRTIAAAILAIAAAIATTAAAEVGPFAAADPCADVRAATDAVWGDEQRRALSTAFAATGLPYADTTAARVGARLDTYVADWRDARVETCAAKQQRRAVSSPIVELQSDCLAQRERALRALLAALVAADAGTVAQAVDSVAALPAIAACDDPEALARSLRPPADPQVAQAVARVREQIARADAQQRTGHDHEALALADAALAQAEEVGDEPVQAEARALRGRVLAGTGDFVGAEAALLDAAELAEAARHDELAADVWIDLMGLANRHLVDPARGEGWIRRARSAQRRLGDQPGRRVQVLAQQGLLDYLQRRYDDSERALRTALELESNHGRDPLVLGKLAHLLANTLEAEARLADARPAYTRALAQMEAALGPDHPEFARVVYDFGTFLTTAGELEPARARLEQALEISTRAYGRSHHVNGRVHIALAQVALNRGDFTDAGAHAGVATQIFREVLAVGHPDHVDAALVRGTAHFFAGELDAALAAFVAAQALQREVTTPDPIATAVIAADIAETQLARADLEAARAGFTEVERLLAGLAVRDDDLVARVLTGRGRIHLAEGDARAALPRLEAALELRRGLPEDPLALAELHAAIDATHAAIARPARSPRSSPTSTPGAQP